MLLSSGELNQDFIVPVLHLVHTDHIGRQTNFALKAPQ